LFAASSAGTFGGHLPATNMGASRYRPMLGADMQKLVTEISAARG
jgi:hypothetical protein